MGEKPSFSVTTKLTNPFAGLSFSGLTLLAVDSWIWGASGKWGFSVRSLLYCSLLFSLKIRWESCVKVSSICGPGGCLPLGFRNIFGGRCSSDSPNSFRCCCPLRSPAHTLWWPRWCWPWRWWRRRGSGRRRRRFHQRHGRQHCHHYHGHHNHHDGLCGDPGGSAPGCHKKNRSSPINSIHISFLSRCHFLQLSFEQRVGLTCHRRSTTESTRTRRARWRIRSCKIFLYHCCGSNNINKKWFGWF